MKEKRTKEKSHKKHKKKRAKSSSDSESDEWVEKETARGQKSEREDWMAMTGIFKTYTKEDIRPKREEKDKKHIDSYNPSTSSRELNPYWKGGGSGLPQTSETFRKSAKFLKPADEDDFYRSSDRKQSTSEYKSMSRGFIKPSDDDIYTKTRSDRSDLNYDKIHQHQLEDGIRGTDHRHNSCTHDKKKLKYSDKRTYNWKKGDKNSDCPPKTEISIHNSTKNKSDNFPMEISKQSDVVNIQGTSSKPLKQTLHSTQYMSDEKMNKLAAKIVKAEIMGDTKLVCELKERLEAAREYRKQNPHAKPDDTSQVEDEGIMLVTTSGSGNSRPLTSSKGDARSKGGKRKADTHISGERAKYFGDDDKYNLAQMFQNEKYGNNYNDEAELAKIASKSKNPNDDLEDIFLDEISKNRSEAKDAESERNRAIQQHVRMEKSLDGCEYCIDSKEMLKHLIVSYGNKVYVAVPSRTSLVPDHCIITTLHHSTCVTGLDEDVWDEIMNYRKALTQFFNSQNKDVVFFETATKLHRFPHMVINCVPMSRDVGDMAAIYFKKALLECEAEWSMNKKVVDLKGKNIRKGIPKGLPYFWIDFGMDPGFAHVIEDQQLFPKTFAEEVIAGILDLDHRQWKNPRREYGDIQRNKVLAFINKWKPFDPVNNK